MANGGVGPWNDFTGLLTADGSSNLAGTMDVDQFDESSRVFWAQSPDANLTGNYAVGPQGRFTGSFTVSTSGITQQAPPLGTLQQVFYVLNSSTVLSLGVNSTPSTGILQLRNF